MPDKSNHDDDTSTIDNEDCCNDVVAMPNKNIDAVVGQLILFVIIQKIKKTNAKLKRKNQYKLPKIKRNKFVV